MKLTVTPIQIATIQLAVVGFFFAMRSCEYLKVPQADQHRTDILRIQCIRFFKDGIELGHDSPILEYADCVSVTFEMQKKDEKGDTVTQIATGDILLCPVRMWAAIVRRLWSYPGTTWDTKVSSVWNEGKIEHITSEIMINALNAACESFGWERLNIQPGDIGTHSIRSGAAMAMYLGDVPVYSIMMLVERRLLAIHSQTGRAIFTQRVKTNDCSSIFQAHPRARPTNNSPRSKTTQPPRQRRDTKECCW
jgi:hypothetical protein